MSQDDVEQELLKRKSVKEGADKGVFLEKLASMPQREKTPEEKADFEKRFSKLIDKLKARQGK